MRYIFFTTFLCLLQIGFGQQTMTLEKAISMGLENNFQIQIADKFIQIADNNDSWAVAGRTPIVDLTGSFNNSYTQDNNPASFLNGSFYNGGLGVGANVSYVLYAGGRIRVTKQQLELATTRERLNRAAGINDLIRDIYQQYYNVILQKERVEVLNSIFTLSKSRLAYEIARKEFGQSNRYNIVQFENAMITDSLNLISQKQATQIAERTLLNTLSIDEYIPYDYPERLNVSKEMINEEMLRNQLLEDNYTLRSIEVLSSLNRLNTKLAQAVKRPTVSAFGSVGFNENGFQFFGDNPNTGDPAPFIFSNRTTATAGLSASWNIYNGNVNNINIQNAEMQEEIDMLTMKEAQLGIINQVNILIDNYDNQLDILDLADKQINLAQENMNISEERFKAGQISSIDYRNIQNQFLNAAFSKVNAIYALIVTKSEIDNLVGAFGE